MKRLATSSSASSLSNDDIVSSPSSSSTILALSPTSSSSSSTILQLPKDIIRDIFDHFTSRELLTVIELVNHQWYSASTSGCGWTHITREITAEKSEWLRYLISGCGHTLGVLHDDQRYQRFSRTRTVSCYMREESAMGSGESWRLNGIHRSSLNPPLHIDTYFPAATSNIRAMTWYLYLPLAINYFSGDTNQICYLPSNARNCVIISSPQQTGAHMNAVITEQLRSTRTGTPAVAVLPRIRIVGYGRQACYDHLQQLTIDGSVRLSPFGDVPHFC
jgi:hypothetical protein